MHQTTYNVDKETKTITVERAFDAPLALVWQAWTDSTILEQWWAPLPWKAVTKTMDFKPGGKWLYFMVGPQGEKHWSLVEYREIKPQQYFTQDSSFCDENGNKNGAGASRWHVAFAAQGDVTNVTTRLTFENIEAMELLVNMGFTGGFAMAHENLDAYIQAQFKLRNEYKTNNRARVCTYLNFPGNTEEAMNFYKSVFKTEFAGKGIQRFGDIPQDAAHPPVAENIKKMVLHAELPTLAGHVLMATDAPKEMGMTVVQGNNMHICLEPETRAEAERIFNSLSDGGKITMPLADMFFGSYFGEFTDRYGINWMVNCMEKK